MLATSRSCLVARAWHDRLLGQQTHSSRTPGETRCSLHTPRTVSLRRHPSTCRRDKLCMAMLDRYPRLLARARSLCNLKTWRSRPQSGFQPGNHHSAWRRSRRRTSPFGNRCTALKGHCPRPLARERNRCNWKTWRSRPQSGFQPGNHHSAWRRSRRRTSPFGSRCTALKDRCRHQTFPPDTPHTKWRARRPKTNRQGNIRTKRAPYR